MFSKRDGRQASGKSSSTSTGGLFGLLRKKKADESSGAQSGATAFSVSAAAADAASESDEQHDMSSCSDSASNATSTTLEDSALYTMTDVATHNSPADCWIVYKASFPFFFSFFFSVFFASSAGSVRALIASSHRIACLM